MTQHEFENTPVTNGMKVNFKNHKHSIIGVNWLAGSIRVKGALENFQLPFQDCEYVIKKSN
jgi:hypothetical protein